MDRLQEIDQELRDRIPELQRREATNRIFEDLGINALLDERQQLLESIRQFEKVFGGGVG